MGQFKQCGFGGARVILGEAMQFVGTGASESLNHAIRCGESDQGPVFGQESQEPVL
ncbi:hypothetical protein D3C74_505920 [compost metagenome]